MVQENLPRPRLHQSALLPLGDQINHLRGQAVFQIEKPAHARYLVLMAERGTWRVRSGAHGSLPTEDIGVDVLDGTGGWRLDGSETRADRKLTVPAPDVITIRGYSNNAVLSFYWV